MIQNGLPTEDPIMNNHKDDENDSGEDSDVKPSRRSGRRKIKIEYIEDKNRRHITFSKRKAGIMKKAYELSTLTGTQVLLLVVSETGLVYTFTTVKLQPIVTKPEGKNLIQACLNAPDPIQNDSENDTSSAYNPGNNGQSRVDIEKKPSKANNNTQDNTKVESIPQPTSNIASNASTTVAAAAPSGYNTGAANAAPTAVPVVVAGGASYQQQPYGSNANTVNTMPPMGTNNYGGHPNYMNPGSPYQQQQQNQPQQQQSPQQQQQQQSYGQMPGPPFYGNQQPQQQHYMQHPGQQQQQQHPGYWTGNSSSPSLRQQEEGKARRGLPPSKK